MPHAIDFDTIESRLFTLHHLALGSRSYCERFRISRACEDIEEYEWSHYMGHLKALVSGTMIDAAIKVRMLQDIAKAEDDEFDVSALQEAASRGLKVGTSDRGDPIALRRSCNKIIHGTEARLVWRDSHASDGREFEYWTGEYRLSGSDQPDTRWEVTINVADWCIAMMRFNSEFQDRIDWGRFVKWDE